MDNLPPLRALQVFDTVGRCGGISEAAKRLGVSAGAVSQQMKILEDALGISLTARDGKRIRLTSAGQRYHQSCASAFENLRIAQAEVEQSKNRSNLRVSALPSLMSGWLAPLVFAWQQSQADVDIYLDGSHAEPSSSGYEIDFRITYSDRALDAENSIELFRDCVVPVCSPALLPSDPAQVTPASLMVYPLLSIDWLPKFASPPSWRDWFKANSVECSQLHDSHRVFSLSAVAIQAAIAGQGFVLAQYSMIEQDIEAGRLVMPLSRPLPMPASYFLTWTKSAFDHDHCRQFHRWLVARGREQSERNLALFEDAGE